MTDTLTPRQVAQALGASEASVKRWCDRGVIPAARTAGGHRRIAPGDVVAFLRRTRHRLADPSVLGLPAVMGVGDATLNRAVSHVQAAMEAGQEARLMGAVSGLYLAGHSVCDICDHVFAPIFAAIGERWEHGDLHVYQERHACEMCVRVVLRLRELLPTLPAEAPYALGGTLFGDPYTLPTTMVEVVLREAGWRAESYGVGHPIETLCAAVRDRAPRLVWLSFSCSTDPTDLAQQTEQLYDAATEIGAAVVVGGRALTEERRRSMRFSVFCDDMAHLVSFVQTLHPRGGAADVPAADGASGDP